MINLKCFLLGHRFKKIARSKCGLTLEKYVECKNCAKVIIIINIHPRYRYLYEGTPRDRLPKSLYVERKLLKRKLDERRRIKLILDDIENNRYGEEHDSTFSKSIDPQFSRAK